MGILLHARGDDQRFLAFATGCEAAGYPVAWLRPSLWSTADFDPDVDIAVVHGLRDKGGAIHAAYRAAEIPVWIVDLPRLRGETGAVGLYLNSLQWLPRRATRSVVCGPVLADRQPEIALVCGQKPGDAAHGMTADQLATWARGAIARARAETGLRVVYRPHPGDTGPVPSDAFGADALSTDGVVTTAFARAALVVTYNSTTGWEAIAAGVPVACDDPACAYTGYQGDLTAKQRAEALGRAASSQWTLAELAEPDVVDVLVQFALDPESDVEPEPESEPEPEPDAKRAKRPRRSRAIT